LRNFDQKKASGPCGLTGFRLSGQLFDFGLKYFTDCALSSKRNRPGVIKKYWNFYDLIICSDAVSVKFSGKLAGG